MATDDFSAPLSREEAVRLATQRLAIDEVMDPGSCDVSEREVDNTWVVHFKDQRADAGGRHCDVIISRREYEVLAVTYGH